MLDKQVNILSVDTGNFYTNKEAYFHWRNHTLRSERNKLTQQCKEIIDDFKNKYSIDKKTLENMYKEYKNNEFDFDSISSPEELELFEVYCRNKTYIELKTKKINESKNKLLALLSNKLENNNSYIRELRNINPSCKNKKNILSNINVPLKNNHTISVFDSFLTRTIGIKADDFTEDFMVVQVYYFDVIKNLIYYGYTYNNEKYIYFSSSAGQIRTKKCVFIKESVWNKHNMTLMCGLSLDKINEKGGCNQNKFLAYTALSNSATDVWEEFNIDKSIVVNDFETNVCGDYDFVDDVDYTVTRKHNAIPIPHMDGCGIMLPKLGKNKMVRLPWVKGLLATFDFRKFIEVNNCSPIVKDLYGVEHDIINEDIEVIFTASQFKMYKYYDSWEQYKDNFKKYHCTANFTKPEEDRIKNTTINYQMLQSITDITDKEIEDIAKKSNNYLNNLCNTVDNIKRAFGITPYNLNKNYLQKSVDLYTDLINDEFFKITLRDIKNSMIKRYKAGSLEVNGKYTFIVPDLYAFCEWLFMGIENPEGLLHDTETFCWLFRKSNKIDCLRSPHLFMEHAIRKNLAYNKCDRQSEIREWFTTNALYTSTHDMISKILQFDKH